MSLNNCPNGEGAECYTCTSDGTKLLPAAGRWRALTARMITCRVCHNKRCPQATDHRLPCTGSNDPGQPGSRYR